MIASDVKVPLERRFLQPFRATAKTAPQAWPGPSSACNQRRPEATILTSFRYQCTVTIAIISDFRLSTFR